MDYLHSPYDALVSINAPSEKARAVVDAMERDMGTTLATKQDLLLVRQDVESRYELLSREIGSQLALNRKGSSSELALVRKDMETLRLSIIGWLGSGLVAGGGVILAAMRLWM